MSEWFEDESFWIEMRPFIFSEERVRIAEEQVEKILKLAGYQDGAILDLCCGLGRHTIALAKRGIKITAVDRTEYLINEAKSEAIKQKLEIEFVLEDMRRFVRQETYSLVINMFTSFGYFEDREDDLSVLRNAYQSLKPGGLFLIDIMGKEIAARKLQPTTSMEAADGALLVERHEVIEDWARMKNEWIIVKGERAKSFKFRHRLYSGQEMKDLFQKAGFEDVKAYGDLDGHEYGLEASRLIVAGRKNH
jgi:SAM-dependent methyltransferase